MTDHVGSDEASEEGGLLYSANEVLSLGLTSDRQASQDILHTAQHSSGVN